MALKTYAEGRRKMRPFNKSHWIPEEDALLIALVHRFGHGSWDHIANHIQGRTGKSCRLRWTNQLDPNINKSPFTKEEQLRLFRLQKEYGNRWSTIVRHFPGRTDNQLKNQYHVLRGTYMRSSDIPYAPVSEEPIGNYFGRFTPCFTEMPVTAQPMPSFPGGGSSVKKQAETWFSHPSFVGANPNNVCYCPMTKHGNPVTSNAATSGIRPVAHPQQGVGIKAPKFIDFMGVGTSE